MKFQTVEPKPKTHKKSKLDTDFKSFCDCCSIPGANDMLQFGIRFSDGLCHT